MSDDVEGIIQAIRQDNPDQEISVIDRGAYVRVQADKRLTLTRKALERNLGRPYEMRELETLLSSFAGRLDSGTDAFTWYAGS
jgi:toluene monooxygenase system protein D